MVEPEHDFKLWVRGESTLTHALKGITTMPLDKPFVVPSDGLVWIDVDTSAGTARVVKFEPVSP